MSPLPPTRRLPRRLLPTPPADWHDLGDGQWHYEGPTTACTVEVDAQDYDELGARKDAAEAQVRLYRYLRAALVHKQREALAAPVALPPRQGVDGVGTSGRPGEPPYAPLAEVSP